MEMKWVTTMPNKREILMGYKGNSFMDSGYFSNKGLMTRYGKKLLDINKKERPATMPGCQAYGPPLPKYRNIDDNWESSQW
jgi:hypothetical protein